MVIDFARLNTLDWENATMWKKIRIFIWLLVLATVVQQTLMERAKLTWEESLYVAVYPINADKNPQVSAYIKRLSKEDFEPIREYFTREAQRHGLALRRPFEIRLGDEVEAVPSPPPVQGNVLQVMLWSLKFRWFAWQHSPKLPVKPDIKLYLLYHNPESHLHLSHSTALNKGRIGRVNVFAGRAWGQKNLVVIAHELLHTVNATDKYDLGTTLPVFPQGYAQPEQQPLYPQRYAELMGGRVPKSPDEADIPATLDMTLIGEMTASEIGWIP